MHFLGTNLVLLIIVFGFNLVPFEFLDDVVDQGNG